MMTTFALLCVIAVSVLALSLLVVIIRLELDVAQARYQAERERMLAQIFQRIARDAKEDAQMWRERAQLSDIADIIESVEEWVNR